MDNTDPEVEVACIQAATSCALASLSDSESGDPGIDQETRDAAREFLRRQWQSYYDDEANDKPGDVIPFVRQGVH